MPDFEKSAGGPQSQQTPQSQAGVGGPLRASQTHPGVHPTIALEAITKTYPGQSAPAVRELDLEVPRGTIAMLVGPSGCGKTTTLIGSPNGLSVPFRFGIQIRLTGLNR